MQNARFSGFEIEKKIVLQPFVIILCTLKNECHCHL